MDGAWTQWLVRVAERHLPTVYKLFKERRTSGPRDVLASDWEAVQQLLPKVALMEADLTSFLGTPSNPQLQGLSGSDRAKVVCSTAHDHAQTILERFRPREEIVVSYKTLDTSTPAGQPRFLRCYYLAARLPEYRKRVENYFDRIPIDACVSGRAFTTGQPIFVTDIREKQDFYSPEMYRKLSSVIGCLIAWPLRLQQSTVGILKVDARNPKVLVENEPTRTLLNALVTNFELAFQIGQTVSGTVSIRGSSDVYTGESI